MVILARMRQGSKIPESLSREEDDIFVSLKKWKSCSCHPKDLSQCYNERMAGLKTKTKMKTIRELNNTKITKVKIMNHSLFNEIIKIDD